MQYRRLSGGLKLMINTFFQHFSKRTLLLILVLIAITGGLLYLALRQQTNTQTVAVLPPTPTPSPAHSTLWLVQEPQSSTSASQIVDVDINGFSNSPSGAQINLSYDPNLLSNVVVKSGTYFNNPAILLNNVDSTNGRITFVLAIQPQGNPATGSGVLATISYTILPTSNPTTTLSFLPKTEITQLGILGSVLKNSSNLTISIPVLLMLSPAPSAMPMH